MTAGLATLALAVSLVWWSGRDVSVLFEDDRAFQGQGWRLVTSVLPHIDLLHLVFNLYWLWVFGTLIEERFGHLKTAGLYLFLAAGSAALAGVFSEDGVGLSGIGYGLFGMLWVLSRWDERFRGAVDSQTIVLFVGWFFLCILLTYSGAMRVGNIAHGAGAILGLLTGWAVVQPRWRRLFAGLAATLLVAALVIGWQWRPYLAWAADREYRAALQAHRAYLSQMRGDHAEAVRLYGEALDSGERSARTWFNLGISYQHLGQLDAARDAYQRATELDPNDRVFKDARDALRRASEPAHPGYP